MVYMMIRVVVLEVLKCEKNRPNRKIKPFYGILWQIRNPIRSHDY